MTRDYTCTKCARQFRVIHEISAPDAVEVPTDILCPHCGTSNQVLWPPGARIVVIPR